MNWIKKYEEFIKKMFCVFTAIVWIIGIAEYRWTECRMPDGVFITVMSFYVLLGASLFAVKQANKESGE